jgi:3',5'-cyclic AMP phosphodiesterase CpdA
MLIAQISDFHLCPERQLAYGVADTAAALEKVITHINGMRPPVDVVIVTGDVADAGEAGSYELAAALLARLQMPFYLVPGNHDHKGLLAAAFPEHAYFSQLVQGQKDTYVCYAIDAYPVRLIGLDTVTPGRHGGGLGDQRLQWLAKKLSENLHTPTLVFMHHPPFASGIGHMDQEHFYGRKRLQTIIKQHPQVQRLCCGHLHRPITQHYGATVAAVCPGVGMQLDLDLRPEAPSGFILEPLLVMIHHCHTLWNAEPIIVTHLAMIENRPGEFGGFHPFYDVISPS